MGIGEDKNLKKGISVTIIATGFNSEQQHEIVNTEAKKIIHTLEEDQSFVQDLTDHEKELKNKGKYNLDKEYNIDAFRNEDLKQDERLKFSKTSATANDKSFETKDNSFKKNDLTKIDQNIKDIETISTQVSHSLIEEVNENESDEIDESIEVFDFEEINNLDSSQIEFDFNESLDSPKTNEVKNSNLENDSEINSFKVKNQNLEDNSKEVNKEDNPEIEDLDDNPEMENLDKDDLNIKIKNLENDETTNGEKIEIDLKDDTPFDNSIEQTIKNSNDSSKEELKKFNYSFQNNIKRINEMDKQPAYKRLGYNIDQNIDNEKKSSLTLDKDINDEIQLRSNNSFLHDNVD